MQKNKASRKLEFTEQNQACMNNHIAKSHKKHSKQRHTQWRNRKCARCVACG